MGTSGAEFAALLKADSKLLTFQLDGLSWHFALHDVLAVPLPYLLSQALG